MKIKIDIHKTKGAHKPYVQDGVEYEEGIIGFELSVKGMPWQNGDRTKLNSIGFQLSEIIATAVCNFEKALNLGREI